MKQNIVNTTVPLYCQQPMQALYLGPNLTRGIYSAADFVFVMNRYYCGKS